jgi:hypothetical protein
VHDLGDLIPKKRYAECLQQLRAAGRRLAGGPPGRPQSIQRACRLALESGVGRAGSSLVITAGVLFGTPGAIISCAPE